MILAESLSDKLAGTIWADPRLIYFVAISGVVLLFITIWLFRRPQRTGRQAGIICLMLSVLAHLALLLLVPLLISSSGGSTTVDDSARQDEVGVASVEFSTFDDSLFSDNASGVDEEVPMTPLPVAQATQAIELPQQEPAVQSLVEQESVVESQPVPESLTEVASDLSDEISESLDSAMGELFATDIQTPEAPEAVVLAMPENTAQSELTLPDTDAPLTDLEPPLKVQPASTSGAPNANVPGKEQDDFANRVGAAKDYALNRTGGSVKTEAAVDAALRYLAQSQRADGAWDPNTTGAGEERSPLGENRGGAGRRSETAITGLALLALMGAGNTHQRGEYADEVYAGLAYLIKTQRRDGSLSGDSSVYAATYCHGIAALAMCEAAAITKDPSAMTGAQRSIQFTHRMQHPSTGGWRYTPGDPGDLSQLGWQAMVLDAGHRAKLSVEQRSVSAMQRFVRSVRTGRAGGLASYRPGEAPSRTMTAEALATRLLIGDAVPQAEIDEAEKYMLQQLPGAGQDNYYYWYYATLALHQLQDDAWETWNHSLQRRLLITQNSDGSWPTSSVWGGYGGKVYSTAMATLCLETYYRHTLRSDKDRIANAGNPLR